MRDIAGRVGSFCKKRLTNAIRGIAGWAVSFWEIPKKWLKKLLRALAAVVVSIILTAFIFLLLFGAYIFCSLGMVPFMCATLALVVAVIYLNQTRESYFFKEQGAFGLDLMAVVAGVLIVICIVLAKRFELMTYYISFAIFCALLVLAPRLRKNSKTSGETDSKTSGETDSKTSGKTGCLANVHDCLMYAVISLFAPILFSGIIYTASVLWDNPRQIYEKYAIEMGKDKDYLNELSEALLPHISNSKKLDLAMRQDRIKYHQAEEGDEAAHRSAIADLTCETGKEAKELSVYLEAYLAIRTGLVQKAMEYSVTICSFLLILCCAKKDDKTQNITGSELQALARIIPIVVTSLGLYWVIQNGFHWFYSLLAHRIDPYYYIYTKFDVFDTVLRGLEGGGVLATIALLSKRAFPPKEADGRPLPGTTG